jgi:hypothetical protein
MTRGVVLRMPVGGGRPTDPAWTERALVAPGPFAPLAYNISSGEYWRLGDVARPRL